MRSGNRQSRVTIATLPEGTLQLCPFLKRVLVSFAYLAKYFEEKKWKTNTKKKKKKVVLSPYLGKQFNFFFSIVHKATTHHTSGEHKALKNRIRISSSRKRK